MNETTVLEIFQAIATIFTALGVIVAAILSYKSQQASKANTTAIEGVKGDVKTIELATNSMKDALVDATLIKGQLQGAETERLAERLRNAAVKADQDKGSAKDPIHVKLAEETEQE